MTDLLVHPASAPLHGSVPVPGDKSIAHRAILLAGLAQGESRIEGGSLGEDNLSMLRALRAMGVGTKEEPGGIFCLDGGGLHGLVAPSGPLDCKGSGTAM